ncbi:hypothetical protein WN48_04455 [Eufriesea mexicana]|nr:hypothetical protein WN48_04455 [Eufriesea mexicana]
MSINVTVNGNYLNIRRGRMVLSDLDQIKKNERDRRRRLRLEQVRQQSKEISDKLLKRTKYITKEELKKLKNNDKLSLKQIYNGKIMEVQQKYQEDMADIGHAHISASLEPDHDALIEEKQRKNKLAVLKRGKEAMKQIRGTQQKENMQQQHQERLQQVREMENLRSTMVVNLSKHSVPEADTIVGNDFKTCSPAQKLKTKTLEANPENDSSILEVQPTPNSIIESSSKPTPYMIESVFNNKNSKKEVTNILTKVDKTARYNPDDYIQTTSESTKTDSSNLFSDDSSYFSDSGEQYINKEMKATKYVKCPATDRVQLYDHNKHQHNIYDQPVGVVEKIHIWNEPSAMDLAQEIERTQNIETHLLENRKYNTKIRGEDAALREKVRRDYQTLMQTLDQLASEERKLKASQIERYSKNVYIQEERRKLLRDQHKKKLNRALKTLLNDESLEQCTSYPIERQISLTPKEHNKNVYIDWDDPCISQKAEMNKISQSKSKESEISREEQILDMLKKVERQKRLLLQEFGADLPNDIFNASTKSLFERDKSVQTRPTAQDICIQKSLSPEIKVINASYDEKDRKDKTEQKDDLSVKKVEIAIQTTTGDKNNVVQDKGTQVELIPQKENESPFVNDKIETISKHYPIEPQITIIRPEVDSSQSTSSDTIKAVTDVDKPSPKIMHKKKRYSMKTLKQTQPKVFHKSCSTRINKISSPVKKFSKSLLKSQYSSPKKCPSTEDVPSKRVKMYVDKNGINIKAKSPKVTEVAVDVSTQSTQIYSAGSEEQNMIKPQWIQSKSKRIKIKDISDTSTSFASPPPIKPKDIIKAINNNISIFEMLDSSTNESMRLLKRDISPVSTPETPSPRTMRMPSNIPHPDKIKKLLRYSSTDSQTNDNNTLSSTKNDYSTTDSSEYQQNEHLSLKSMNNIYSKVPVSLGSCLCNNPECRQVHAKFDEIRNYALKNCPQILQKYEDLQTTCAERIISLTNLIEKVRNEQKGMELSMIDPNDETSLMQLPPPQMTTDLQSVHKLVENIEAIHNQLAKTLFESQKIIKNKPVIKEETKQSKEMGTSTNGDNTIHPVEQKVELEKAKVKPKIINEERVKSEHSVE